MYTVLASIKEDKGITQVVGVHEADKNSATLIDVIRKRAKTLELRDSVTMVFAHQSQVEAFLPSHACESLVIQDSKT